MKKESVLSIIIISICIAAGVISVSAQRRYANVYTRADVDNFVRSLEDSSDVFSREFNNAGGTSSTERRTVSNFENAVDRLRRNFSSGNNWWSSRNDVQGMMTQARQVNVLMNNERFARRLESQWRDLRRDINKLADTYELPELAGGGWNPGGPGFPGGGGGGNVPNWAVGTFYGRNPNTGGQITMNVSQNGSVTITLDGSSYPTYATLNRQNLTNAGIRSRVTRLSNGIRTTRTDNGEIIDYFRDGPGGGGGGYDPPGGNVPSWVRGTFYGRNPMTGGRITLNIDTSGNVTIQFDNAYPTNATLNGTTLYNQGIQSRVSRLNNGIRTTRLDNGEVLDYYRTFR